MILLSKTIFLLLVSVEVIADDALRELPIVGDDIEYLNGFWNLSCSPIHANVTNNCEFCSSLLLKGKVPGDLITD